MGGVDWIARDMCAKQKNVQKMVMESKWFSNDFFFSRTVPHAPEPQFRWVEQLLATRDNIMELDLHSYFLLWTYFLFFWRLCKRRRKAGVRRPFLFKGINDIAHINLCPLFFKNSYYGTRFAFLFFIMKLFSDFLAIMQTPA